jgi:hypothetical protein
MSASGERKIKHGDVFDDCDEYYRIHLETANGVWTMLYIKKDGSVSWLGDAFRREAFSLPSYVYKFNIIDVISNALKD